MEKQFPVDPMRERTHQAFLGIVMMGKNVAQRLSKMLVSLGGCCWGNVVV